MNDLYNHIKTFDFNPLPVEIEVKDLPLHKNLHKILSTPHRVSFYQLIWIKRGSAKYKIDFQDISIKANEVLVISPGQVCEFDTQSDYQGSLIIFTDSFFSVSDKDAQFLHTSHIFNILNLNKVVSLNLSLMDNLVTLLKEELIKSLDPFKAEISQSMLRIILLEAERSFNGDKKSNISTIASKFLDAVENNFRQEKTTKYYAQLIGVGEKTLVKELKSIKQSTPKSYIDKRIILEAKRLLAHSELSVKEVGFTIGFDEPANFNNFFRKHTQLTPIQFRESTKNT